MTEDKLQMYAQTIIDGGSVIQSIIGYFFEDSSLEKPSIVIAKQMQIDIYHFDGGNDLKQNATIYLNKSIDQISVIKGNNQFSKQDLLLIITSQYELFIVQFSGTSNYQIIKQFELIPILIKDKRVQIPFQKKVSPYLDYCRISQDVSLVCFTLQESNNIQNQLLFISFQTLAKQININIGFASFQNTYNGLITSVGFMEPIDKQVDGNFMNPILFLHQQYNNRIYTFEILPCLFLQKFDSGINYIQEGIMLDDGPFTVLNLADYSISRPISQIDFYSKVRPQNWLLFPIITVSFDRIMVNYNMKYSKSIQIGQNSANSQNFRTLNALSRPLVIKQVFYPKIGRHFYFISSFDDGSLLHIDIDFSQDDPVIFAQTLEWPLISNSRLRLPTCTSLCPIPWYNQKTQRQLIFLGSQSIDSTILELLGTKSPTLQRFNDRFSQIFGAIQDLCVCSDGRMFLCTSHGRDGSIINLRFGYQLKSLSQLKIDEVHKKDTISSFIYSKQIFIAIQGKMQSTIYQYHKEVDDVCQLFKIPDFHELSYLTKHNSILTTSVFNKIILVTENQLFIDKNSFLIEAQQALQIQNDIYLVNKNTLQIFDVINKQQIIQTVKLDFIIQKLQSIQIQNVTFVFAFLEKNNLALFLKQGQTLVTQKIFQMTTPFDSVAFLSHSGQLIMFLSSKEQIFRCTVTVNQSILKIDESSLQVVFVRSSKCQLIQQNNYVFIKSESSLYFIEILTNNELHFIPLLTSPLTTIPKIAILPEQSLDDVGIYCNDDRCFIPNNIPHMISYPTINTSTIQEYLKFMFIIITDNMLENSKDAPQYQAMYAEDDDHTNYYYINVCKINITPSFSTQRSLIKRSPIQIQRYQNLNILVLLSEQYLGKMQLRIFDQNTRIELHKLILDSSICVNFDFANVNGVTYFLFARYQVIDIHSNFSHQNQNLVRHDPQIDVMVINANKTVRKVGIFKFPTDTPCLSMCVKGSRVYCAVGSQIVCYELSTVFSAVNNPVMIGEGIYIQKLAKLDFDASTIENITIHEKIYFTTSGILVIADLTLENFKSYSEHADLKLISPFQLGCVIIDHCNEIKYIDNNGVVISSIQIAQNITVMKSFKNRIILATDTGGIAVLTLRNGVFLQFLRNEISASFEQIGQKLNVPEAFDSVDGDVVRRFVKLSSSEQESIAIRLNVTRESILQLIKDVDIECTD